MACCFLSVNEVQLVNFATVLFSLWAASNGPVLLSCTSVYAPGRLLKEWLWNKRLQMYIPLFCMQHLWLD